MSIKVLCVACQTGHHWMHVDVVKPPPRDGVGGDVCPCRGECEAPTVDQCSTFDCRRPAVVNGRCEGCEEIVAKYALTSHLPEEGDHA